MVKETGDGKGCRGESDHVTVYAYIWTAFLLTRFLVSTRVLYSRSLHPVTHEPSVLARLQDSRIVARIPKRTSIASSHDMHTFTSREKIPFYPQHRLPFKHVSPSMLVCPSNAIRHQTTHTIAMPPISPNLPNNPNSQPSNPNPSHQVPNHKSKHPQPQATHSIPKSKGTPGPSASHDCVRSPKPISIRLSGQGLDAYGPGTSRYIIIVCPSRWCEGRFVGDLIDVLVGQQRCCSARFVMITVAGRHRPSRQRTRPNDLDYGIQERILASPRFQSLSIW
jgi:hypothetical protein